MKAVQALKRIIRTRSISALSSPHRVSPRSLQVRLYSHRSISQSTPLRPSVLSKQIQPSTFWNFLGKRHSSTEPSLSLSQRFRKLSREYGWSAVGVYLLLTALDLPLCFLAVRWLGSERIGHWEKTVMDWIWAIIPYPRRAQPTEQKLEVNNNDQQTETYGVVDSTGETVGIPVYDHGLKEAEEQSQREDASIWTQLALAYAIHKSFIFIRVPIAAAVTPKVVKVLRGWGWDIGKRKPKALKGS